MSPEQATGEAIDARSDVFSLGIILFEVVTGTRFVPEKEVTAILGKLLGAAPLPTARSRSPQVPPELDAFISAALSREPAGRPADGGALHELLEDWLHAQPEKAGTTAVADHLKGLFGAAWGKRSEFIEAARQGQLTPSGLRKGLRTGDTDATMPGGTPSGEHAAVAPVRPLWPVLLGGAAIIAVALGGLAISRLASGPTVATVVELPTKALPAPVERPTMVRVETEPAGAEVTIDGIARGPSPVEVAGLGIGEHEVTAALPGRTPTGRTLILHEPGERAQLARALRGAAEPAPAKPTEPRAAVAPVGRGKLTLQTTLGLAYIF
jgi:serine/threonine-protein kinase